MQKGGLARVIEAEEEEFGMFIEQSKISKGVPNCLSIPQRSDISFSICKDEGAGRCRRRQKIEGN